MNIIIQNCYLQKELLLRHSEVKCLGQYLLKTNSITLVSQDFFKTVSLAYSSLVRRKATKSNQALKKFNFTLPDKRFHQPYIGVEYQDIVDEFLKKLKMTLRIHHDHSASVEPLGNSQAEEYHAPENLSWDYLRSLCKISKEKQIAVIGTESKICSFTEAAEERYTFDYKIYYYESIKDFLDEHAVKLEFLTDDWLSENLIFDHVYDHIISSANKGSNDLIFNVPNLNFTKHFKYKILQLQPLDREFTVYAMPDNSLKIFIKMRMEFDIEISIKKKSSSVFGNSIKKMRDNLYADVETVVILMDKKIIDIDHITYTNIDQNL